MTVLITGGKGFIGHNLVCSLASRGFKIVVIDNNTRVSPAFNRVKGVNYIFDNIKNIDGYSKYNFDAVVHLAATVSVDQCDDLPVRSYENNIVSTIAVAEFCKKYKIKNLIFSSTAAVYNKDKNRYGFAKKLCEKILKYTLLKSETKTTVLRFFNVYGEGAHRTGQYSPVIEKFLQQKTNNEPLTLFYPGTQTRDFIHAEDICNLIYKILITEKKYHYKIFDVCSGKETKIKDIAKQISDNIILKKGREKEILNSRSKTANKVKLFFQWIPKQKIKKYIINRL